MTARTFSLIIFFLLNNLTVLGQEIISSKIIDSTNNKPISFANIYIKNHSEIGTTSNQLGKFKLKIPKELINNKIVISCISYQKQEFTVASFSNKETIKLNPKSVHLEDVIIDSKMDLTAKKIVRKTVRKIRKNYNKRFYSADFNFTNYLFVDSTKELVGQTKANGVLNSYGISRDFKEDKIKINKAYCSQNMDSLSSCVWAKNSFYGNLEFDAIKSFLFQEDFSFFPVLFVDAFFDNCYFSIEETEFINEREIIVIKAVKDNHVCMDYKMPEKEFRKKYRRNLKKYKTKCNYSPDNKLFVCTENYFDSLFYSQLRKKMQIGDTHNISVLLYIDKKSNAILKSLVKFKKFNPNKTLLYKFNVSTSYKEIENKYFLNNIDIVVSNSKNVNINLSYNFISINFDNIKTRKRINKIKKDEVFNRSQSLEKCSKETFHLKKEEWNIIKDLEFLKPVN